MIQVTPRKNEHIDSVLKRLKRKVLRNGLVQEVRGREYFVRPGEKARQKSKAARIRKRREARLAERAQLGI